MQNTFKLGRVGGIEIGIHYTWLFAFALITWSLAGSAFPASYPGWSSGTYWLAGAVTAILLFVSVLLHELSHSFVALARGQEVDSITLFIFGGVSNLKAEPDDPKDEFLISVVGPLSSFVIAGVCYLLAQALGGGQSILAAIVGYLASVNFMLAVFNLLPGFPLDGGRVFRSIVWAATGSLRRATQVASIVGQGIGWLLILFGVSQLLSGQFFNGLWIAFIGWFLNNAAESIRQQQVVSESLQGIRVADLMNPQPPLASPDLAVDRFVHDHVLARGERAMLVLDQGRLLGIVSMSDAKHLPREEWATTPVAKIMTPVPLKTVTPESDLKDALQMLVADSHHQVPVVRNGQVVGILNRADILRFLQTRQELGMTRAERARAAAARSSPPATDRPTTVRP